MQPWELRKYVCAACGYSLRGVEGKQCPECGLLIRDCAQLPAWRRTHRVLQYGSVIMSLCHVVLVVGLCHRYWQERDKQPTWPANVLFGVIDGLGWLILPATVFAVTTFVRRLPPLGYIAIAMLLLVLAIRMTVRLWWLI